MGCLGLAAPSPQRRHYPLCKRAWWLATGADQRLRRSLLPPRPARIDPPSDQQHRGASGHLQLHPLGTLEASTGSAANPFRFGGQYQDMESGLYYLRARYYDAATGQFLTVDPAITSTRSPYGYADGNPLNATDSTGKSWVSDLIGNAVCTGVGFFGPGKVGAALGFGCGVLWGLPGYASSSAPPPRCTTQRTFNHSRRISNPPTPNSGKLEHGETSNCPTYQEDLAGINQAKQALANYLRNQYEAYGQLQGQ